MDSYDTKICILIKSYLKHCIHKAKDAEASLSEKKKTPCFTSHLFYFKCSALTYPIKGSNMTLHKLTLRAFVSEKCSRKNHTSCFETLIFLLSIFPIVSLEVISPDFRHNKAWSAANGW